MLQSSHQPGRQRPFLHGWRGRVLAVISGLSLFVVAEVICHLFGWGQVTDYDDPFVGFSEIHPLFVRDIGGENFVVAPSRRKSFPPESFPVRKPTGSRRVFCLGGSTVQGNPYSKETSFTTWLELNLEAADPDRDWQVINCGGISYASYRLVPILQECLAYQPDLFVICTGENEFLEDRTYPHLKHAPRLLLISQQAVARLRTYTLMRRAVLNLVQRREPSRRRGTDSLASVSAKGRPVLKAEVDPWLDYNGGLKVYHRDEVWKQGVITHFESNLRRMVALAREAGVPVILVKPMSNLRDCPPFKSEHRAGLTDSERREWEYLSAQAASCLERDPQSAVELLREAIRIDDQFAATFYALGKCHEALGQSGSARAAFQRARELDVCPLRLLQPIERVLERVTAETRTPIIDAHALLERQSRLGILGDDWMLDHVHPSIQGHQIIAGALMDTMARQGWVNPRADWKAKRDKLWPQQLASLGGDYFRAGEVALNGLRAWTQGRASGPPIEYRILAGRLREQHP